MRFTKTFIYGFTFVLLTALLPITGMAGESATNRVPGPMITPQAWPGGNSMPSGKLAIIDHMSYSEGKAYKGTSRQDQRNASGQKVGPKSNELFVNVLKFRYGLAWDRLDIRTATPFINNHINTHGGDGMWKGGIGDTTMLLRYQVKQRTNESPFTFAVDGGITLPTGHTGDKDKYLATNAFGVVFGGGASWINHNQRVDFDGSYVVYLNEGKHDIQPGNYAMFHGHYAYAFSDMIDLGLETSLRLEEEREVDGRGQDNAYTEWYAGPKVNIKLPQYKGLNIGAAALFPLYRDYDATTLSADVKWEFRISMTF